MTLPGSSFPKKRRIIKKYTKNLQVAALILASLIYLGFKNLPFTKYVDAKDEICVVERVIDGDTLKLSDGRKVRLIGVDTPEVYFSSKLARDAAKSGRDIKSIQAMGKKASNFTKSLCAGKKVKLQTDVEKSDKYGRTLAYVYLEDGAFVNARIIEEGYGQAMTVPPNVKYSDQFLQLQQEARKAGKGLWGDSDGRH